jgi:predicted transcriptional regulator
VASLLVAMVSRQCRDSAQRLTYTGFAHELAVAIAPNLRHQTIEAFNREINDFVNRVRPHMNVEPHAFKIIDEQGLQALLSFPTAGL